MTGSKLTTLVVGAVAFAYYALLSAKSYTWVFVSYDSGDWLACANWWMVPQPYGSPLYILLCRLVGMFPGSQAVNMTLILSVLPAAISVALVYAITIKLTDRRLIAIVASCALLASVVVLTQATVVEQYSLAVMFLTLALYLRLQGRPKLTALALGFGAAVHIIVLLVAVFWLVADYKYWRRNVRAIVIAGATITVSYSFILVLMAMDTPRLLAGGLSVTNVLDYITTTGGAVVGQLSIFELPRRVWDMFRILLVSLGLTIVPIYVGLRGSVPYLKPALLGTVAAAVGYYFICVDYTTWTFLAFAAPSLAIIAGVGLSKLHPNHTKVVLAGCICLAVLNGVFMNADVLTRQNPVAREYYNTLKGMPAGTTIVVNAGYYSLGLFYALSTGSDLVPIIHPYMDDWEFEDYRMWLDETYGLGSWQGANTTDLVGLALMRDPDVYFFGNDPELEKCLEFEEVGNLRKIVGVR